MTSIWSERAPLAGRFGLAGEAWAAIAATVVWERTSSMACWARAQTGCAGQCAFLEHDLPGMRQTLRQMEPSIASITSRMDALLPRAVMRKPPDCPRREVMSPARAKACSTLERKLSGAPVARPTESSRGRRNRQRASVASTSSFSSSRCPLEQISHTPARRQFQSKRLRVDAWNKRYGQRAA